MTIENFKDLTNRVAAIQSYLKIDEKRMDLKEAELKNEYPSEFKIYKRPRMGSY